MDATAEIGIVGLGTMGRNLALNMQDRGFAVVGTDAAAASQATATEAGIVVAADLAELASRLTPPRLVLLMVPAGPPVDEAQGLLLPHLAAGDVLIDGGNTHWRDTERRTVAAAARGVHYLGVGISGGEEGARNGPSIMVGGAEAGWRRAEPVLTAIAARTAAGPCCARLGPGGSGHFVKMVHNGIEYALMQLIAEAYAQLRERQGMDASAIADVVGGWRRASDVYLLELTERALREPDLLTGLPLVDVILDKAEQKGTGAWASIAAIELGVPAPTLIEAAQARSLSALKELRSSLGGRADDRVARPPTRIGPEGLGGALAAAVVLAFAQGFVLMREASSSFGWNLDLAAVARLWQGGCIIRADLLGEIERAIAARPGSQTLLEDPGLMALLERHAPHLRAFVADAAQAGLAVPAHGSALAWLDGIMTARGPANLIQAQRDLFGAHRFERTDKPGHFHHAWGTLT